MPFRLYRSPKTGCGARLLTGGVITIAALLGWGIVAQFIPTSQPTPTATAIATLQPVAAQIAAVSPTAIPAATHTATPLPLPTPTSIATLAARAAEILILVPTDTPQVVLPSAPSQPQVTIHGEINVRRGPGTDYAIFGNSSAGRQYPVIGRDAGGAWWAIDFNGQTGWVFAELVTASGVEAVPVVEGPALPASAAAAPPVAIEQTEMIPVDPACDIKGNVNREGKKIYHTRASEFYGATQIRPEEGDRWFCTTAEAEAAGFRAPRN